MQEKLKNISDLELSNYFVNKAFSTLEALPEEARLYREELLQRLSLQDWQKQEYKSVKKGIIEEFKNKLIKKIKDFRILLLPYQSRFGEIIILHGDIKYKPQEAMCEELENLINNTK